MAIDIALTDIFADAVVDLQAAFDLNHDKAADLITLLYEEAIAKAPLLANALYKVDGGTNEKSVSEVAQTLMKMATRLMIANRSRTYRVAIREAEHAIVYAVEHARKVEDRKKVSPANAA